MLKLEDIAPNVRIAGLVGPGTVEVVQVAWYGASCLSVSYRSAEGMSGERLLYRADEPSLALVEDAPAGFSAPARDFKLAAEALRIERASLFDPYQAVHTSKVRPLPHQIMAVYQEMLPRLPLRYVLADDPGAGKTVMCGLLIKEMMARGALERCLVVCPGSLCEQWQDELQDKFGLAFALLQGASVRDALAREPLLIARLDKLARDEEAQEELRRTRWDLIVVDEAHKMSATFTGGEVKATKRYRLGQLLGQITENYLLLTATPHNGKPVDFNLFMALVDPDRFEGAPRAAAASGEGAAPDVSDCMRRLVKEELLTFEGTPLFPERRAVTVGYTLSEKEAALYGAVTEYVRTEFNRADSLDGKRRQSVGLALTTLQRRLASSPEAIYQSLKRRRARLSARLDELNRAAARTALTPWTGAPWALSDPDGFDEDDLSPEEVDALGDDVADTATAARTAAELEAEIARLEQLERQAAEVRAKGVDRKWEELARLLQEAPEMFGPAGREKLIIFTEHKDTLRYLEERTATLLGAPSSVLTIHGGMGREARRAAEERFRRDSAARVLICTDAAGEGINLQCAHLMINYDLPWNPNRLEQRFGRIHRIGQTEVCWLWNLVAEGTREGDVWERLFGKLEEERQALGGRVFDILGEVRFENAPLKDLLLRAVRYGEDPKVRAHLHEVVDESLDTGALRRIIDEKALAKDLLGPADVADVQRSMERADAGRLEPYHLEAFLVPALERLGGTVREREEGRYEVVRVPAAVRRRMRAEGGEELRRYERVCFDRALEELPGRPPATCLDAGHPLVRACAAALLDEAGAALEEGAVLVDREDGGTAPRLLVCIEETVADGVETQAAGRCAVARELLYVEVEGEGRARAVGPAPYLDCDEPSEAECALVRAWCAEHAEEVPAEERARMLAIEEALPALVERERAVRIPRTAKVRRAVRERLSAEVRHWCARAWELDEEARAGKEGAAGGAAYARERAEELEARLKARMAALDAEERLYALPPRVLARALVVPAGFLAALSGAAPDPSAQAAREAVERAAMEAAMDIERRLGNAPVDVSAERGRGYDIESAPAAGPLRFIEVKGRVSGATEVTLTRNEGLCALECAQSFILAIVEVEADGNGARALRATYLSRPLESYDRAASKTTYTIADLCARARTVCTYEELDK